MQTAFATACPEPRCPEVTHGGRCPAHKRQRQRQQDAKRPTATQRGYDAEWRKLRNAVIARDPICQTCGQAPSTDAAHIIPRAQGGQDTMENLRGACHSCHSSETATRDGAFGNTVRW